MVRHEVPLDDLALFLLRQDMKNRPQLPTRLAENRLAPAFGHEYHVILWQQSRNVPFRQSRNVPLISDRSLPFPHVRIVLLAAEPVKASLRRAQRRRAALTEPAASLTPFSLT